MALPGSPSPQPLKIRRANNMWRKTLALILVIVGCLLIPFATLSAWLSNTIVNTEAFVATVSPLSQNQAIDNAVANFVTTKLFTQADIQNLITNLLPDQAKPLAAPLTDQLQNYVQEQVAKIVGSPQFNQIWTQALRVTHEQLMKVLFNQGQIITAAQGVVTLDLGALVDAVKARLSQNGVTIFNNINLPVADRQIVLLNSPQLAQLQAALATLNSLAIVLPVFAFVFLAGAVAISPNRRITLTQVGLGFIGAGLVLVIAVLLGQSAYLGQTQLSPDAALALYWTLVRVVWYAAWSILGFGILLALVTSLAFK